MVGGAHLALCAAMGALILCPGLLSPLSPTELRRTERGRGVIPTRAPIWRGQARGGDGGVGGSAGGSVM